MIEWVQPGVSVCADTPENRVEFERLKRRLLDRWGPSLSAGQTKFSDEVLEQMKSSNSQSRWEVRK